MMNLSDVALSATLLLQQHTPWLADKVTGAVLTQAVKELWEQVKTKLGQGATQKVEAQPNDSTQWEIFRAKLLTALDEDKEFYSRIKALVQRERDTAGISQTATGNNNKQVLVENSQNVRTRIK